MENNNYQPITEREAFANMGLHRKDDTTFFLANMIIEVGENSLKITKISGRNSSEPEDTYETERPFVFTHNGVNYVLKVESGNLNIYEEQQLIGGDIS
jgi:hypothetical protein